MNVTVLSSLATREAYLELVPSFEAATGHKVATTWAGTVQIVKRMADGEIFDLVISSNASIGDLIKQRTIAPGSNVNLAQSGIGMGLRKGTPRPDIGSTETFKHTLLSAQSIGMSTGPSGVYMEKLFERLGVADAIKSKIKLIPSGGTVSTLLANEEAEIGFQQVSEIAHAEGIDYAGPLPPELQLISVFTAGVHSKAAAADVAKALVQFLITPAAVAVMKKHGLEEAVRA
jgi:molybdate transport system substrate-binding protein